MKLFPFSFKISINCEINENVHRVQYSFDNQRTFTHNHKKDVELYFKLFCCVCDFIGD